MDKPAGSPLQAGLELDLIMTQRRTLRYVSALQGCTNKQLAVAMGLNAASAATLIDRLVELSFITRRDHLADRRQHDVRLTRDGHAPLAKVQA